MSRGVGMVVLLVLFLLVSPTASHAQAKPVRARTVTSQQTVPAPHWGSAKTPGAKTAAAPSPTPKVAVCTHTVRSGESISRIAARYRVTRAALIDANQLVNPHALRSGQRLSVPGCQPPVPQTTAGETPGIEPDADGILIKRVGPRRILTSLVLGTPDFREERITLVWPVEGPVISIFGQRSRGWHAGIDITADMGSEVYAAAPGTIVYSGWIRAYGQVVKIQHTNGFITLYAHNQKNLVEVGEDVEAGQLIATVGRSGHATGPHVHFEVRRDGKAYNPLHLLEPSDQSPVFDEDIAASSSEHDHHE
ncbi:MAG TPA: peptidoglycan DD-metalloendopeptidase family protein [Methylomirabilota bacterium]|nr:peptidoglycan DD-metalloendopeptidase family protein [Methylomirabilota bacterium]